MKGIKTTIIGIIVVILGITIFTLWFLDIIDNEKLTLGLASIGTFGTTIGLFFSKDSDKSHSVNGKSTILNTGGHPNPNKEEK